MNSISDLKSYEVILQSVLKVLGGLIVLAKFLFLTIWGWIIILLLFILVIWVKSKNRKDEFSFTNFIAGFSETLFWFYSNLTTILISIAVIITIGLINNTLKDVSKSLTLYREIKTLEAVLKNLKSERKLLEVTAASVKEGDVPKIGVKIKYFAYSPVKDTDIQTGESIYMIEGKKLYVDFGVFNFDYSLVEKGQAKNIAYPDRIYSDTVAFDKGVGIMATADGQPLSFKLDAQNIYSIELKDFQDEIGKILVAASDEAKARRMGIRNSFSEAIGVPVDNGKSYSFYSTAVGGIVVK